MTYAVKTVENLFTWCGHEIYPMMVEITALFPATQYVASVRTALLPATQYVASVRTALLPATQNVYLMSGAVKKCISL